MRKAVFWTGAIVFVLAVLCFFLSGAENGPTPEQVSPTVPFLYGTSQGLWMLLGLAGFVVLIVGALRKSKEQGKKRR